MHSFNMKVVLHNYLRQTQDAGIVETAGQMTLGHITATRYYAKSDMGLSGWVVRNEDDRHHMSDPLENKERAKQVMRQMYDDTVNKRGHHL